MVDKVKTEITLKDIAEADERYKKDIAKIDERFNKATDPKTRK